MSLGSGMQIEGNKGLDTSNLYHQRVQTELKEKNEANKAEEKHDLFVNKQNQTPPDPAQLKESFNIKDEVVLSALEWEKSMDKPEDNKALEFKNKMLSDLKQNGEKLRRHLGQKIDFGKRIPQLKEMFKFNLIRSRSHNKYLSRFAQFKVGVVGQILALMGVPIEELRKLKKDALKEAFEKNQEDMAENIYTQEVTELMLGGKRSKRTLAMCGEMQTQLTQRMNQIGPVGYWSKIRVMEEKIVQCQKIIDEFQKEKSVLEYEVQYREQVLQ
jgi:hypothetical protein